MDDIDVRLKNALENHEEVTDPDMLDRMQQGMALVERCLSCDKAPPDLNARAMMSADACRTCDVTAWFEMHTKP